MNERERGLTGGFAANVTEECGDFLHLHQLATGGSEPERLIYVGGDDEGLVVPEAHGVGHGGVPLGEKILELVDLEDVGDRLVTAVLRPSVTLPLRLPAHLLALHRLHLRLPVIGFCRQYQEAQGQECNNRKGGDPLCLHSQSSSFSFSNSSRRMWFFFLLASRELLTRRRIGSEGRVREKHFVFVLFMFGKISIWTFDFIVVYICPCSSFLFVALALARRRQPPTLVSFKNSHVLWTFHMIILI